MRLVIDSKDAVTGSLLHLKVAGFSIGISDISVASTISIIEDLGKISVEILPVEAVTEPVIVVEPVSEMTPVVAVAPLVEAVAVVRDDSSDLLFQRLVALRRQISQEVKLPPYIIFHDTSLKDMVSKLPVDLELMKNISGVGQAKLEKYGERFAEVIKTFVSEVA